MSIHFSRNPKYDEDDLFIKQNKLDYRSQRQEKKTKCFALMNTHCVIKTATYFLDTKPLPEKDPTKMKHPQ